MHPYIPRAAGAAALLLLSVACSDPAPMEPIDQPTYDLLFERAAENAVPRLSLLPLDGGAPVSLAPELVARDPDPSPGGLWVAYVVENVREYEIDVWIARRDGSEARRLTDHWEIDDQPAWSPDGTRLAFRSWRAGGEGDIWVMNADGSGLRNLTPDPLPGVTDEMRPAWSPDGSRIAFVSNRGGDVDIWTMRADGTDFRRVTSSPDYDTEPTWSPDGRWIAFRRSAPVVGSDLMVVAATGGEPRRLALAGEQRQPSWSPDGSLIAFVYQPAFNRGQPEIQTVRPDGTGLRTRTVDPAWGGGLNPSWIRR